MVLGIHHISLKCEATEDFVAALAFYRDTLGMRLVREWPEGVMLDAGGGQIELFRNGPGVRALGAIRHVALRVDDVDACAERVRRAGYPVFVGPKDIVFPSDPPLRARVAFCRGPLAEEIEFFREKGED